MPLISVIMPTLGRAERLKIAVNSLRRSTQIPVECIVVSEERASLQAAEALGCQIVNAGGTAVEKWNIGAAQALGEWIALGADDLIYHKSWAEEALRANIGGYVGFNDVWLKLKEFSTHFMMTRSFMVEHNGGCLAIPAYHSWCIDMETAARAKRAGVYVWARKAIVEHRHVDHGIARMDATYEIGRKWHEIDKTIFENRELAGFPDDFEPVIVGAKLGS